MVLKASQRKNQDEDKKYVFYEKICYKKLVAWRPGALTH